MQINPALYINITEKCNMRCKYCPIFGENHEETDEQIPLDQLERILAAAAASGFETFRISGGEPMLYPRTVLAIIDTLNRLGKSDIIVNTNGFNLERYAGELKQRRIGKLKVSLDSAERDRFNAITNSQLFDRVLSGIKAATSLGLPTELNIVLMKLNLPDFWGVLRLCEELQISLKVLDLVEYDELVSDVTDSAAFWRENYIDPIDLVPTLEMEYGPATEVRLSGGRGIPMQKFNIRGGGSLTLKPSRAGSTFGSVCRTCTHFPCQEGLFHVSLSAEGNLTPCRLRRDLVVPLAQASSEDIVVALGQARQPFEEAFFVRETRSFSAVGAGAA